MLSLKNADPAGHTCARLVNEVEYRLHRQNYRSTDLVRAFVPGLCRLRIAELVEASGAAVFIARFGLRGYIEEVEDKTPGEATDAWALCASASG